MSRYIVLAMLCLAATPAHADDLYPMQAKSISLGGFAASSTILMNKTAITLSPRWQKANWDYRFASRRLSPNAKN